MLTSHVMTDHWAFRQIKMALLQHAQTVCSWDGPVFGQHDIRYAFDRLCCCLAPGCGFCDMNALCHDMVQHHKAGVLWALVWRPPCNCFQTRMLM